MDSALRKKLNEMIYEINQDPTKKSKLTTFNAMQKQDKDEFEKKQLEELDAFVTDLHEHGEKEKIAAMRRDVEDAKRRKAEADKQKKIDELKDNPLFQALAAAKAPVGGAAASSR